MIATLDVVLFWGEETVASPNTFTLTYTTSRFNFLSNGTVRLNVSSGQSGLPLEFVPVTSAPSWTNTFATMHPVMNEINSLNLYYIKVQNYYLYVDVKAPGLLGGT